MTEPDISRAAHLLEQAIALHAKHMNGTAPTTGPDGMRSQMEMMDMMRGALRALSDDPRRKLAASLLRHKMP